MKRRGPKGLSSLEWFVLAAIVAFSYAYSTKSHSMGNYVAEFIEIYDADTLTLKVWLWPSTSQATGQYAIENMRLYGIDTPERGWRAKCPEEADQALRARKFVKDILATQDVLLLDVEPARGKFGRPLITLWIHIGEERRKSLADMLIEEGYARPFYGNTKRVDWCGVSITPREGIDIGSLA